MVFEKKFVFAAAGAVALWSGYAAAQEVNAVDDTYEVEAGASLDVGAPGVLGNDSFSLDDDDDDDSSDDDSSMQLSAQLLEDVESGTLSLESDGSFLFAPEDGFTGEVRFEYLARFALYGDSAEVTITVAPADQAPVIEDIPDQTATENVAFSLDLAEFVSDADTPQDELEFAATEALPPGLELRSDGELTGVPEPGSAAGDYEIVFSVSGGGAEVTGSVNLQILPARSVDLSANVSAEPNPVRLDEPATWTVAATNDGEATASGVQLEAVFTRRAPFSFDSPSDSACMLDQSGNESQLSCSFSEVPAGETRSVELVGRSSQPGDVHAFATVSLEAGPVTDPNEDNDSAVSALSVSERIGTAAAQTLSGIDARAVATGDFNGDGRVDVAVATAESTGLLVFETVTDPDNADKLALAEEPRTLGDAVLDHDVTAVDLDGDSDLDLVTAGGAGVANRVFLNVEGDAFDVVVLAGADAGARAVGTGDADGDGFVDLVFATDAGNAVYLSQGAAGAYAEPVSLAGAAGVDVAAADLVGDAAVELVFASADADAAIYGYDGNGFEQIATLATGPTTSVATGDFNNDSAIDLVFGREEGSASGDVPSNPVFLNTSGATASFVRSERLGAAPTTDVLVGDTDLDDDPDIAALRADGAHRIFANTSTSSAAFGVHPHQPTSSSPRDGALAPLSVDDRVDLVIADADGLKVFYNDGFGDFGVGDDEPPTIELAGQSSVSLTVGEDWSDPGATATDAVDGDLTDEVVENGDSVDTSVVGTYVVEYDVTDSSGNAAETVTREISVEAREQTEGGGGGAFGLLGLLSTVAASLARRRRSRLRHVFGSSGSDRSGARIGSRRPRRISRLFVLACLALPGGQAAAELGYTYVDFGAVRAAPGATGQQTPVPGQTVFVRPDAGDGTSVGGSLAIGERFYVAASYASSIVDVEATAMSPLTTTTTMGTFDLLQTRVAFGYRRGLAENLDLLAELSYDGTEYDFGSFAGENFDLRDSGAGFGAGLRWQPGTRVELYAIARTLAAGEADLTARTFDKETTLTTGVRWQFFEGLGLGVEYVSADVERVNVSLRFGFGDLGWGGD